MDSQTSDQMTKLFLYTTHRCDLQRGPKHCPAPLGLIVVLNSFLSTFLNPWEKILLLLQHMRLGEVLVGLYLNPL